MQAAIAGTSVTGSDTLRRFDRSETPNPLSNIYRTSDNRFISLAMLQSDRYWQGFCDAVGRPDLRYDPWYADGDARRENAKVCIAELDAVFGARTQSEWCRVLATQEGQWAPVGVPGEAEADPQACANGYVFNGRLRWTCSRDAGLGAGAVQHHTGRAARLAGDGEHTEEILLEHGFDWADIAALKDAGAVN